MALPKNARQRDAISEAKRLGVEVYINKKGELTFRHMNHPVCPIFATSTNRHDAGLALISWLRKVERILG